MLIDPLNLSLQQYFKLSSFRLGQEAIIKSVMAGHDVLAVMPTGGGKSLCYQLPALLIEGITIVVSPLVALMNDQVAALRKMQIPAGCIHSGISIDEKKLVFKEMSASKHFILYVSPERVQKPGFSQWLQKQKVALFAIDEAHCVSQWGHDFRPEYSLLNILRRYHPQVPMMGLTATATPLVKTDIKRQLHLANPDEHVYGFYRENLYYQVEFCVDDSEKEPFVFNALHQTPQGRVIIYCGTRKKTEDWFELLQASGFNVGFYHAGLSTQKRNQVEEDFQSGKIRILTATNAFGMGVDIPDIRLVIHTQLNGNIESYYQEVGRAGRDGKDSTCLLTYSKKDKGLQSFFITQSDADRQIKTQRWSALDAMVQYAEGSECRHADILTYFKDQKRISKCGHCDSCAPLSPRRIEKPQRKSSFKPTKSTKKKEALFIPSLSDDQQWRMDALRQWRKDYAKENDIPAFIVFSDKTLKDLVLRAPTNEKDLAKVYGLGEKKIDLFGKILIEKLHPKSL